MRIFSSIVEKKSGKTLILGRAGIGKSIFCRYVAYQWAIDNLWPEYELLALIPLRRLTADRYPPLSVGKTYTLSDLIKREVLDDQIPPNDVERVFQHFDQRNVLWILDGYDEVAQNIPSHLRSLLDDYLLKTSHHILTSRPFLNSLCYPLKLEIIGFTNENIINYVKQFFEQMEDDIEDAVMQGDRLLKYLNSNRSVWGVAHIPMNLESICSTWNNVDWSLTRRLTITRLHKRVTEWLFRRYLNTRKINNPLSDIEEVFNEHCATELSCMELLAFSAMKSNTIVLRPNLLKRAAEELRVS